MIPSLEKVDITKNHLQILILVPTRELALQTSQVTKELGKHMKVEVMVTTGGTSLKDDIMRLYNPVHILVATPGRYVPFYTVSWLCGRAALVSSLQSCSATPTVTNAAPPLPAEFSI